MPGRSVSHYCFAQFLYIILHKIYLYFKKFDYRRNNNLIMFLSMLFQCCFLNVEATLMNIRWFNFHFQPNINVETTLGHRHWIEVILSTLFCQRWNNVDKHTLAQLSISTKFQCWNNIGSSTLNQRNSIDVASTLFCQRWNNVDKCTSAQLSFSTKYQRWNNVDERWRSTLFQRWFNVYVFAGKWMESLM